MSKFKHSMAAVLTVMGLFPTSQAMAGLSLVLSDNDATPSVTSVFRGNTFNVSVKLISTTSNVADRFVGGSYQLSGPVIGIGNVFTLISRDEVGIPANNTIIYNNDNTVVLDNTAANGFPARLNPTNGVDQNTGDLGGSFPGSSPVPISNTNPNGATVAGASNSALIANYSILVAPNAPAGNYTLTIVPITVTVYDSSTNLAADGFYSTAPSNSQIQNSFVVTVAVPEPSSILLLGMGVSTLGLRRRRR